MQGGPGILRAAFFLEAKLKKRGRRKIYLSEIG
jgi:hypothetical protein